VDLLGEVLLDRERSHLHSVEPGEYEQSEGHHRVGLEDRFCSERHIDQDALELASVQQRRRPPALPAAVELFVWVGSLEAKLEHVSDVQVCRIEQALGRVLLAEAPVDVDVLRASG
jgi:hypothetical protein